jgi:hypothetical protein
MKVPPDTLKYNVHVSDKEIEILDDEGSKIFTLPLDVGLAMATVLAVVIAPQIETAQRKAYLNGKNEGRAEVEQKVAYVANLVFGRIPENIGA